MLVKSIYHAKEREYQDERCKDQIVNASINVQIKFQKKISKPSFRITGRTFTVVNETLLNAM